MQVVQYKTGLINNHTADKCRRILKSKQSEPTLKSVISRACLRKKCKRSRAGKHMANKQTRWKRYWQLENGWSIRAIFTFCYAFFITYEMQQHIYIRQTFDYKAQKSFKRQPHSAVEQICWQWPWKCNIVHVQYAKYLTFSGFCCK